jgi:RNA polymerase sigma-70 factor (ECF subfamily)
LFARYARLVLGLAQRVLAGRDEAEDLAQDVFVHALSRLDTLDNPQAFAAWICTIVVRTASKRLRRQRMLVRLGLRTPHVVDPDALIAPNTPADAAAELQEVYGALSQLPAEERIALVLRRVEGMELAEVAERMNLSLATVKRRLTAAEQRLRRAQGVK